jgi:hypothetical protein
MADNMWTAQLPFSLLIPIDPVWKRMNLTLVLNYFEMNQMFTEIIIKTLEEDIIWLTKN